MKTTLFSETSTLMAVLLLLNKGDRGCLQSFMDLNMDYIRSSRGTDSAVEILMDLGFYTLPPDDKLREINMQYRRERVVGPVDRDNVFESSYLLLLLTNLKNTKPIICYKTDRLYDNMGEMTEHVKLAGAGHTRDWYTSIGNEAVKTGMLVEIGKSGVFGISSTSEYNRDLYGFLGQVVGSALAGSQLMTINFPVVVWEIIIGKLEIGSLTWKNIEKYDEYLYKEFLQIDESNLQGRKERDLVTDKIF